MTGDTPERAGAGEIRLAPIGAIRTPFRAGPGTPIQGPLSDGAPGTVVLRDEHAPGLRDVDGFSHLILIYQFHRVAPAGAGEGELLQRPYLDDEKRGVFAIRSPRRPNPIGVTVVELVAVEGPRLRVRGVDMLDGTPLLDLKPYVPRFDCFPEAQSGWLAGRREDERVVTADDRFHRSDGEGD